jgi:hypothetical protein
LYFYDIKIQTNLSLNDVEGKITKTIYRYIYKKGKTQKRNNKKTQKIQAQPQGWTQPLVNRGGLSPAAWAGLMFQPTGEGKEPLAGYCA